MTSPRNPRAPLSGNKKRENTETKNYKNLPAEWQYIRPAVPFIFCFLQKGGDGVSVLLVWRPDENQRVTVLAGCAW